MQDKYLHANITVSLTFKIMRYVVKKNIKIRCITDFYNLIKEEVKDQYHVL